MEVPVGMRKNFSRPDDDEEREKCYRVLKGYMGYVNLPDNFGRNLSVE